MGLQFFAMKSEPRRRKRNTPPRMVRALAAAQQIAFGPLAFQAVRAMLKCGMLEYLEQNQPATRNDLVARYGRYMADVLTESGVTAGVLTEAEDGTLTLSDVGYCLLSDEMTRANFDFVADVCYLGADKLWESLAESKPSGLKVFGEWPTIYEGLSRLPEPARTSWFTFDHLYSDAFFAQAIELMRANASLENVFDVGGNTGKFAGCLLRTVEDANVTIVDLPGQLEMARANMAWAGERCRYAAANVLSDAPWPTGASVVWMSQFLDCFSHEQIVHILRKAAAVLVPGGSIFISEPFIDCQTFDAAAYSLAQGSLYFTCMANGNSKFYTAAEMEECVREAGLQVRQSWHSLGKYQYSLMQCVLA